MSETWAQFQAEYGEQVQLRMRRLLKQWGRENDYDLEILERARRAAIDMLFQGEKQ